MNLRTSEWRQSFRWRQLDNEWTCALHGRILSLKQDAKYLHYKATWPDRKKPLLTPPRSATPSTVGAEDKEEPDDTETLLRDYFNLDVNLTALYEQWSSADLNFEKRAPKFTGIRILRQDAWESLVCFICSSCNNIPRITQMVEKLCINYGPLINQKGGIPFHDFPSPENLAGDDVEARLRELGFGYRAKYLAQTARLVAREKPAGWLDSLSNPQPPGAAGSVDIKPSGRDGYREAHTELVKLQGVGPKVADCVCLMGLGWSESVPVDTHVWQIAQRDYKFGKGKHKSLTKVTYDAIGDHFRNLWGKEAGWAHSVLFAADLRTFSDRLTTKVEVEVEEVKIKTEDIAGKQSLIESRTVIKREFEEEKTELGDLRSQRASKRRRT